MSENLKKLQPVFDGHGNALNCQQPKAIPFSVIERERKQDIHISKAGSKEFSLVFLKNYLN